MTLHITTRQKREYYPVLIGWQGYKCCYCQADIFSFKPVFDHLLDDPSKNNIKDVAIACQACNIKKITEPYLKKKAKLIHEQWKNLSRGGEGASFSSFDLFSPSLKPEMAINKTNMKLTEQKLYEYVSLYGSFPVKDAIDAITMYCYKETGTGSQKVISQYVKAHTSIEGKFRIISDGKKQMIVERQDPDELLKITTDWDSLLQESIV